MEVAKLLFNGLIGSMTFGMYWQYKSLKAIEKHNQEFNEQIKNCNLELYKNGSKK